MSWSAQLYRRFEAPRTRPARDLVAAIELETVRHAVDLGCGPGNSTEVLAARYPEAALVGIDSSPDMIATARERLPTVRFEVTDIAAWQPAGAVDLLLANASLQWLDDHQHLYPRLISYLTADGCLAVQTPDNFAEPAHRVARELAGAPQWVDSIGMVRHPLRHDAQWYYSLLRPVCRQVDVWRTTYFHPLPDHAAVVDWFKASALRPYLLALTPARQEDFLAQYHEGITQALPALADGSVLLPFPRLFLVARR